MSKARQSTRKRYRKPRADYQAGGRVNARTGGGGSQRFTEYDAVMPKGGKKIPKKKTKAQNNNEASAELNYNTDEVSRLPPSQINQIRMWRTNILFYGIEDLLDE